jgi:hypothetical protein
MTLRKSTINTLLGFSRRNDDMDSSLPRDFVCDALLSSFKLEFATIVKFAELIIYGKYFQFSGPSANLFAMHSKHQNKALY